MKKLIALLSVFTALMVSSVAYADNSITVIYNEKTLEFTEEPIIMNDKTLVQLRPIAEAMDLTISFSNLDGSVILTDGETTVIFKVDLAKKLVNGKEFLMDVPMVLRNDYTFVPVRDLVEPFGEEIGYDGTTRTVTIVTPDEILEPEIEEEEIFDENMVISKEEEIEEQRVISTGSGKYDYVYYTQSQPDLEFENSGRGYCWVCSYAMVFSEASGEVITPLDIAQYNIEEGYDGNFMAPHEQIAQEFGFQLVPALSEDSDYFLEFGTKNRGETSILAETDEEVIEALKEALDAFPQGVIVRFEKYPHSMVAVGYDGDTIYFNDPGIKKGEHVPFEETCLKNYNWTDLSYIQAIEVL